MLSFLLKRLKRVGGFASVVICINFCCCERKKNLREIENSDHLVFLECRGFTIVNLR